MSGKKYEFTEEQIKYIIDNWDNESPHSMKRSLGVHGMLFAK